jgi:hypothetical protein
VPLERFSIVFPLHLSVISIHAYNVLWWNSSPLFHCCFISSSPFVKQFLVGSTFPQSWNYHWEA